MRYNVYVVTAAQFVADLYAHLLAGQSLGQAVTAARRALAANPVRQIGAEPVALQDWAVPIVYEAAPLILLQPLEMHAAPVIRLTAAGSMASHVGAAGPVCPPPPPDAGFFGRDETLLALDRAFDTQPVVLLHGYAGAGKSSTAAEFARWYLATGALDQTGHPDGLPGLALWSSFEYHYTAEQAIASVGDVFAGLLEVSGVPWQAVTDPAQRRDIVLRVLAQVPVLWVWDNVEPINGFPASTLSAWTTAEQHDLGSLLRDLAQNTRCKVLLTSRRDERGRLGDHFPGRVRLPPMPMRESLQLTAALAARRGHNIARADWRPLLRYAAGNPLTIMVLVGLVLRENLTSTDSIDSFVAMLRAGNTQLEAEEDAALGRTRSLAASLTYGFVRAFSSAERAQLAVLHLFHDTTYVDVLCFMGTPSAAKDDAVPELAGLDRTVGNALLDRAADIGLLSPLGGGHYHIHPALPWYFTSLFTATYGQHGEPTAQRAARAYARATAALGGYYSRQAEAGSAHEVLWALRSEESNLLNALTIARDAGLWDAAGGCLQGLAVLYERTGRDYEWARLISSIAPDFTDPATGGPRPGREIHWNAVTGYRVRLAIRTRDWPAAATLLKAVASWNKHHVDTALAIPANSLTSDQHNRIRTHIASLIDLGDVLRYQNDRGCVSHYKDALALSQKFGDRHVESVAAEKLGLAFLRISELRDLEEAERWFRHCLGLRPQTDQFNQAKVLQLLAAIDLERFAVARATFQAKSTQLNYLNATLHGYQQVLDLVPTDDHDMRGITHNQIGVAYEYAGDNSQALRHFEQAIQHYEIMGDTYRAGQLRYNIALLLRSVNHSNALHYAHAALHDYRQAGPSASSDAAAVERMIEELESDSQ